MNKNPIFCFFGIDGAGKTTIINEIEKKLEKEGHPYKTIYMGRAGNHKLSFIKKIIKIRSKRICKKKGLDYKKVKGHLVDIYRKRSVFWLIGYYIEMWLRYLEAIKLSKKNIVLMDRYFYDGLILADKGLNIFKYLTPNPMRSFLLHASPKLIIKRKQEAGEKDVLNFYKEAKTLSKFFNITMIDNSKRLKDSVGEIYETIKKDIKT